MKPLRTAAWFLATLMLLAVAAAWMQPAMMVELANLMWSCF